MARIGVDISKAKKILINGGLIGMPTETVYGLAGNALNAESVSKIFITKNRPQFDPLIVHVASIDQVKEYVLDIPEKALVLAEKFWPGPLTLLLPKNPAISDLVTSGLGTVAIRIPAKTITLQLLGELDFPLTAPSANPFGYVSPTTAEHVNDQLGDKIEYILNGGPCEVGLESTIIGFEEDGPIIYRLGGISKEAVEGLTGTVKLTPHSSSNPSAPGMLKSHYAPRKPIFLGDVNELLSELGHSNRVGIISYKDHYKQVHESHQMALSKRGDLEEAARNLFSVLRSMDSREIDIIIAETVPNHGIGRAINDRLKRASAK